MMSTSESCVRNGGESVRTRLAEIVLCAFAPLSAAFGVFTDCV